MVTSGQQTIAAAGTAEALGDKVVNGPVVIKALDTNTGIVAIGNDGAGDVTVSNGLRLAAGDVCVLLVQGNISQIIVDSAVNGEGVSWIATDF